MGKDEVGMCQVSCTLIPVLIIIKCPQGQVYQCVHRGANDLTVCGYSKVQHSELVIDASNKMYKLMQIHQKNE